MAIQRVKCTLVRGGTTKGVFIDAADLPTEPGQRDQLILALFGSPDTRQINGLGGGDPLSSKVVIMQRTPASDMDVEYLSGEVGIDEAVINYSTLCGNLAAGAALYALEAGWVKKTEPMTIVRIRNRNTGKFLTAHIPTAAGACVMEPCRHTGTGGYGTQMTLTFHDPAGAITGHLLPTGQVVDTFSLPQREPIRCSIVDCGTLYGFVPAEALGLSGDEGALELDAKAVFKESMELLREQVAMVLRQRLGEVYPLAQIKLAIVSSANDAPNTVVSRVINSYKTHKAYPVSGAICLNAAAAIEGTVVHDLVSSSGPWCGIDIAHPTGAVTVHTRLEGNRDRYTIIETVINRSARVLMEGVAYAHVADEALDDQTLPLAVPMSPSAVLSSLSVSAPSLNHRHS